MVVEDEAVVSMMIEQMLEDFGCDVVDMASRLRPAVQTAATTQAELVLLDMNLAGEAVDDVVEVLQQRGISFIFATGYGRHDMRPCWRQYPVVAKPFRAEQLKSTMLDALKG
jgi:CheY-like chemotaxis protein